MKGPRSSHWGTPRKDMGPVKVLWDGDGVTPPGVDRWAPVKTVPSHGTTYAGTKYGALGGLF